MGHDHNQNGHWDSYRAGRTKLKEKEPEGNFPLYMRVGGWGLGAVVLAGVFTYFAKSHSNFGDILHGITDVSTIYGMACLAVLYVGERLSRQQVNMYAGVFNTAFLFLSAFGIGIDVLFRQTHGIDPPIAGISSTIQLAGNLWQYKLLHAAHAHDHEHGGHAFWSTLQHVFYDAMFSAVVVAICLISIYGGADIVDLDRRTALFLALALLATGFRNSWKLYKGEKIELV